MISNKEKTLRNQFGIDATVSREEVSGEQAGRANKKLLEMGEALNPKPDCFKHLGSAAFHIYYNDTLKQVFFVNQTHGSLKDTPEAIVQYAVKDFIGTLMEKFGQRRPKWRSGF